MASRSQAIAAVQLLLLISSAAAFDVMEILKPRAEFSTSTKYLVDFKLVDEINSRSTVTVVVLDNTAVAAISALPTDQAKNAISYHVLLDYYDPYVFKRLNKTALIPSLAGKVNFTELPGERMMLGSAAPGAPVDSEIIKVVGARPYNLSVLQVTKAIGLGSGAASPKADSASSPVDVAYDKSAAPAAAAPKASPDTSSNTSATVPEEKSSINSVAEKADANASFAALQAAAPKGSAAAPQAAAPKASGAAPKVSAAAPTASAAASKADTQVADADAPTPNAVADTSTSSDEVRTSTSSDEADGPSLETAPGT